MFGFIADLGLNSRLSVTRVWFYSLSLEVFPIGQVLNSISRRNLISEKHIAFPVRGAPNFPMRNRAQTRLNLDLVKTIVLCKKSV